MNTYQITEWTARMIRETVKPGDLCVDATMGNGYDTALLSTLAGGSGRVIAFDIQNTALVHTKKRLLKNGCPDNVTLLLESHANMASYIEPGTVSCMTFNFGYLPGGDHSIATRADTSLAAIEAGLTLLKVGGLMSLCIYSGGDTGFDERDAILSFLHDLDPRKYLVLKTEYYNRPNHPPIPAFVIRLT